MVASGADARLLSSLNMELGQLFSDAVGRICDKAGVDPSWLGFVASHGQTVWHEPDASRVYADGKRYHAPTLQLGEPALIAYPHNVRVVANFRAMDMAAGGQGAPLVPFSEVVLYGADDCNRALLNVGGIGNVTVLPAGRRRFSCAGSCSTKGSCRSSAAFARQARGAPPARYAEYAQ